MTSRGLRVNTDLVAAEVLDGEAVIINLGNGMYHTMDGVGAEVWLLIEQGLTLDAMVELLAGRYGVPADTMRADLTELEDELLQASLVVSTDEPQAPGAAPTELGGEGEPTAYAKPVLTTYADLGDVLALDPPLPVLDPDPGP